MRKSMSLTRGSIRLVSSLTMRTLHVKRERGFPSLVRTYEKGGKSVI